MPLLWLGAVAHRLELELEVCGQRPDAGARLDGHPCDGLCERIMNVKVVAAGAYAYGGHTSKASAALLGTLWNGVTGGRGKWVKSS